MYGDKILMEKRETRRQQKSTSSLDLHYETTVVFVFFCNEDGENVDSKKYLFP